MTVRYMQKITCNQSISRRCYPILMLSHIYTLRTVIWLMNNIINNDSTASKNDSVNEAALLAARDREATETPRRAPRRGGHEVRGSPRLPASARRRQVTSPVLAMLLI